MSFTTNSTGGEYKHKLTEDEMPSHNHKLYARGGPTAQVSSPFAENRPIIQGSNYYGFNVSSAGGDTSHNNVQPYITVYFWKRTV
jgi:microcystin-dependent protein